MHTLVTHFWCFFLCPHPNRAEIGKLSLSKGICLSSATLQPW